MPDLMEVSVINQPGKFLATGREDIMHHSVELVDVHVRLGNVEILRGVNIEAKPWEFVSIVGANGAGKTTLLKVVNGIFKPSMGQSLCFGSRPTPVQ